MELSVSTVASAVQKPNKFGSLLCCEVCDVPINTAKDMKMHEKTARHLLNAMKCSRAPNRVLPDVRWFDERDENTFDVNTLTVMTPRKYQVELFRKALLGDCVCFLPTGTGKTLVSGMVISRLLDLNPCHSVLFLVDKILLTVQQSQVIKNELGHKLFNRWNEKMQRMESRHLRVAMMCGEKTELNGFVLSEQDVVVVTAAFYFNLLNDGVVRWTDNCLVVFDEVHHCLNDHPYNQVMRASGHVDLPPERRPRILGLTASPVGYESTKRTSVDILRELLFTVGVQRIIAVVENADELAEYQSNTDLIIREVRYSTDEENLSRELRVYALHCFNELARLSDARSVILEFAMFPDDLSNAERVGELAEQLSVTTMMSMIDSLEFVTPCTMSAKLVVLTLSVHIRVLGEALDSLESLGIDSAFQELKILLDDTFMGSFVKADQMCLPCKNLKLLTTAYFVDPNKKLNGPDFDSLIHHIRQHSFSWSMS